MDRLVEELLLNRLVLLLRHVAYAVLPQKLEKQQLSLLLLPRQLHMRLRGCIWAWLVLRTLVKDLCWAEILVLGVELLKRELGLLRVGVGAHVAVVRVSTRGIRWRVERHHLAWLSHFLIFLSSAILRPAHRVSPVLHIKLFLG